MTLRTFLYDVTYMPQKNQSAAGIKRSKHDYCNSFNNEITIKLLFEFRNYCKVLIRHGILLSLICFNVPYIYIMNITKVGIQKQYHYFIMVYRNLPST